MSRIFKLAALCSVFLSGCVIRPEVKTADPAKIPATQADINALRGDLSQSFQAMYNALAQQIQDGKSPAAAAKKKTEKK